MTDSKKLAKKVSAHIEKNLGGNAFQSTLGYISYIAYEESQKRSDCSSE